MVNDEHEAFLQQFAGAVTQPTAAATQPAASPEVEP